MSATAIPKPQDAALPLRANFAWTLAGNILYAACQWGMLVAIAKLGTPEMVGQFALGLAIAAPVFMLTNLQLRAVQATDARADYRFGHYLALRALGTAVALAGVAAVLLLAGYRRETALVVLAVTLAKAAESFSDVLYGQWQQRERLDHIARAMILRGITSLVALAAVLYFTRDIALAVAAMAVAWLACLVTVERNISRRMLDVGSPTSEVRSHIEEDHPTPFTQSEPSAREVSPLAPAFDWPRLQQLALLSAPLGVVMLLLSLNVNVPRYFVEAHLGEAALGYFSAMAYVVVAGGTVMTALGQSAAPRLSRYYLDNRPAFKLLLAKMCLLAAALGAAAVLAAAVAGGPILTLLYRADYAAHADIFLWLMIASAIGFVTTAMGSAFTATRKFEAYVKPFTVVTILGTVAAALLIPQFGLYGAAMAVLFVSVLHLLAVMLLLYGVLRKQPVS